MNKRLLFSVFILCSIGTNALAQQRSPREDAQVDLTGNWVPLITEHWRWRMVTPPKGNYASVPLNDAGKKAADAWDQVKEAYMLTRRTYGSWYGLPPADYADWYPDRMSEQEIAGRRSEIMLGSPEEIAANLKRLRDIAGDRLHVMFRVKYPGIPHERVSNAIKLLGQIRALLKQPAGV